MKECSCLSATPMALPSLPLFSPLQISATPAAKLATAVFPLISLSIRKTLLSYARGKFVKHIKICSKHPFYGCDHNFVAKTRANFSDRTPQFTEEQSGYPHEYEDESDVSTNSSISETLSLGIKEPIYEVIEVKPSGVASKKNVSRRQLLKSSGLRLRDIRSVDPSLWVTNSTPSILVREQAILLNLGSLRAMAKADNVLVFDHRSKGGQAFLKALLPRLSPQNSNGSPTMPFELEVVEAALVSRTQRLERKLMEVEPNVAALLEMLPTRLTVDILEQLRLSKQALVELASRAGALRQMLLELLEDTSAIRRMTLIGRSCVLRKVDGIVECSIPSDKQVAEEEEEEIEMLLENYLQRSESCHGQAERLLDTAREMEDSIAVNLSSRRLEVSRLELLLQVGTFCTALGALIAGIFGMNLKSYLEERVFAFWITTAGIICGAMALFVLMYSYLKNRKIL